MTKWVSFICNLIPSILTFIKRRLQDFHWWRLSKPSNKSSHAQVLRQLREVKLKVIEKIRLDLIIQKQLDSKLRRYRKGSDLHDDCKHKKALLLNTIQDKKDLIAKLDEKIQAVWEKVVELKGLHEQEVECSSFNWQAYQDDLNQGVTAVLNWADGFLRNKVEEDLTFLKISKAHGC